MSTNEGRSRTAREIARSSAFSDEDLRLCRNLPYAMVGYPFRAEDLRERFYGVTRSEDGWLGVILRMSPSAGTSGALPALFQQYVAVLREAEQLRQR